MAEKTSKQKPSTSKAVGASTTADARPLQRRMIQNFLLIWVDGSIDESKQDCQGTLVQLRTVINDVEVFTQPDQCIQFLKNVDDVKAFVIVTGIVGQYLVPNIHTIPQLDAIYILCGNKSRHEKWTKEWAKVQGVHTDIKPICEALQVAAKQCNQDAIAVSFVTAGEGGSNQLEPSFMYTQIFKEILLEMDHDMKKSIKDLIHYCRKQYVENVGELNIINEFGREYQSQLSIWWYTRECFTYQILNRALRTLEADTIITMGFFIRDLHRQIEQLHQQQLSRYQGKSFIVYRGQGLLETDFEKLIKTQGGLMSFNNFLSTSKNRDVSLGFAKGALRKTNMIGILFKMTIDPSISSTPFAAIDKVSYFNTEAEVLFSMHTVFRIGEIKKLDKNNRLFQVELTLTGDDDQHLRTLTDRIRQEVDGTGWQRLSTLLMKIGKFNQAEELYIVLLEQTSDEGEKAVYYNNLGYLEDYQGDYEKAIWYYEKALEIYQKTLPPNNPDLAISYNNIGLVYKNMGEYSKALSFYEKALEILQEALPPNHPSLATSYNNIGGVYKNMGDYSKALSFYEKDLAICQKTLPPNHPDLATSYNNIGGVYHNMGEYSKALSSHEKALETREKTLPSNHPDLATSYSNIGSVYDNKGEYSKALSFHEKALEIRQKTLPLNHPSLATSYNNIGGVYHKMGEHLKALSFYEKDLAICQKSLPPNHPDLATSYNNIAIVYFNMENYSKALSLFERALDIYQRSLPPNHPDIQDGRKSIEIVKKKL